jgi:PKHD-type hydroxylase
MILCIADVLTADVLEEVYQQLQTSNFVDGKQTAGWHARLVKHNQQLDQHTVEASRLQTLVQTALQQNAVFQSAVLPQRINPILFSRYECGMAYGSHVDNAFMGDHPRLRSDVSLTLFLSQPETYVGGELVIETTQGEQPFKLPAGAMVIYPSSTLHRVETVTAGIRLAAVTWVQSLVRDVTAREILFDLDTTRHALFSQYGKTQEFDLITKSYANLLRRWGEG